MKRYLLIVLFACSSTVAFTQVGSLDASFGNNGLQLFHPVPDFAPVVLKVLTAPDKSYYTVYSYQYNQLITVAKCLSNGSIDPSYGTAGYSDLVTMNFVDASLQDDGKLVVTGNTWYMHQDITIARFDKEGSLDASFNDDGILTFSYAGSSYDYALSFTLSDNLLAVTGYTMTAVGSFAFYHVDVYDLAGSEVGRIFLGKTIPLHSFYPSAYNYSVAIKDDKVVLAATVPDFTGAGNFFSIQRYFATGDPDYGFGQDGIDTLGNSFFSGAAQIALQGDKIVVASHSHNTVNDDYGFAVGRYNNNGSLDKSFNGNGQKITVFGPGAPVDPRAVVIQGDKIIVGGNIYNPSTQKIDFALARYNNNGSTDNSFDGDGRQVTSLNGHFLSFEKMAIVANRLSVTGLATTDPSSAGYLGVAALYRLEDITSISCPAAKTVFTDKGLCSAVVKEIDAVVTSTTGNTGMSYKLTGATIGAGQGSASGKKFNKGVTTVTYTAIADPTKKCIFLVTVVDNEGPVITRVSASPGGLWPANHKMRNLTIWYTASDNCGAVSTVLSVKSNEADAGISPDDVPKDWEVIDSRHVKLRAERSGNGNGRIYTVTITSTDGSGNVATNSVNVTVPHHMGPGGQYFTDDFPYRKESDNGDDLQVKVLPNPSSTYFTLLTGSTNKEKVSLRITNVLGAVVETRHNLQANGTLQVGHTYFDGIYFAELIQGSNKVVVKLIKQQ